MKKFQDDSNIIMAFANREKRREFRSRSLLLLQRKN